MRTAARALAARARARRRTKVAPASAHCHLESFFYSLQLARSRRQNKISRSAADLYDSHAASEPIGGHQICQHTSFQVEGNEPGLMGVACFDSERSTSRAGVGS